MNKKYEVIFQDEYNNLYRLGVYARLEDSIDDINSYLEVYDFKITKDDLKEYPSTFGEAFDLEVSNLTEDEDKQEELWGVMIRGFVLYE